MGKKIGNFSGIEVEGLFRGLGWFGALGFRVSVAWSEFHHWYCNSRAVYSTSRDTPNIPDNVPHSFKYI